VMKRVTSPVHFVSFLYSADRNVYVRLAIFWQKLEAGCMEKQRRSEKNSYNLYFSFHNTFCRQHDRVVSGRKG
jgi:hypothetical protein